jgi:hypothetical protein
MAGVGFPAGKRFFSTASRLALGPTQPPIQWVPGVISPGVKRLTTHLRLVPRWWSYTSTPPLHLHGVLLNYLSKQTPLHFTYTNEITDMKLVFGIWLIGRCQTDMSALILQDRWRCFVKVQSVVAYSVLSRSGMEMAFQDWIDATFIHQWLYSLLQPFVGPWPLFQFRNPIHRR